MRFIHLLFVGIVLSSTTQASVVCTPPLIQAVQSERMSFVIQLIRGGVDINAINAIGRTAVHYAVKMNNLPALELLLDNGADLNLTDSAGNTPLDLWHEHKNKDMLALLHDAGAKPSFTKIEEQQPIISPTTDIVPSPENKGESQDLWHAAASNDVAAAKSLLAEGADTKAKNAEGKTPFEVAAEAEHAAVTALLLKATAGYQRCR